MKKTILSSIVVILFLMRLAPAATRLVPDEYVTIQAAIDSCVNGDVVIVTPGIYTGPGNRDIDFNGKAITVRSTDPNDRNIVAATIIDCNYKGNEWRQGFYFHSREDANSVLDGVTITNGYAYGLVECENSSPIISNCIITGNYWSRGISISKGSPTITNCIITHNLHGGGIYCGLHSSPSITNCLITGNSCEDPGGGGILCLGSSPSIINCTIADNVGGGIKCFSESTPSISNCVLGGNVPQQIQCGGARSRVSATYSNVQGGWGGEGNINEDPCFAFSGDYHLTQNSPCIDAGTNNPIGGLPTKDLDGNLRPLDGDGDANSIADIGVYEFNAQKPLMALSEKSVEFFMVEGEADPNDQKLSIRNCGGGTLVWEVIEDCSWLKVYPTSGESNGEINDVSLSIRASGFTVGTYNCELTITANDIINSPWTVAVTVHVRGEVLHVPSEYESIQNAIDASFSGDTIVVAPGTYYEGIDFGGKDIILQSTDPRNRSVVSNTIIDGSRNIWSGSVVTFSGTECGACVLSGFTITNGRGTYGCGGGIFGNGTQATIQYNIISENWAISYSLPSSGFGGGIYDCDGTIQYNIISKNRALCNEGTSEGGGLYGCDGKIQYNMISHNSVGGLVWGYACGGGLSDCHGTIQHNIISHNSTLFISWFPAGRLSGGGLSNCRATIQNNTITENTAQSGGGLSNCTGLIRNCIIWDNEDGQIYGSEADVRYSDIEGGYNGTGNIDNDPCFVEPGYWALGDDPNIVVEPNDPNAIWIEGDYHLLEDSPCINAGDPNYVAGPNETDLDGKLRVIGGRIDMGAYEYSPPIWADMDIEPDTLNLTSKGKWITAFIMLPEGYDVAVIDSNSVYLEGEIEPERFWLAEDNQIAIAKFSREEVQAVLIAGEVELTITGQLSDGTIFEATDVIRVVNEGRRKN